MNKLIIGYVILQLPEDILSVFMIVTNVRIFNFSELSQNNILTNIHVPSLLSTYTRDDDALIEARQEMKTFLLNRKSATTDDRQQLLFGQDKHDILNIKKKRCAIFIRCCCLQQYICIDKYRMNSCHILNIKSCCGSSPQTQKCAKMAFVCL